MLLPHFLNNLFTIYRNIIKPSILMNLTYFSLSTEKLNPPPK